MKRLWMRLGLASSILGVGGTGTYVATRGSAPDDDSSVAVVAPETPEGESDDDGAAPRPIAIPESPESLENVAGYSNELGSEEPNSSARFVDSSSPSAYAESPASYSIGDEDSDASAATAPEEESTPTSAYAPPSYASDYANEPPADASPYASRYGDPANAVNSSDEETPGASLRSPQPLSDDASESRYGGYADSAPVAAPVPQPIANETSTPTVVDEPATVASNEPPSLYGEEPPASPTYAPADTTTPIAPPSLLSGSTIQRPAVDTSYAANTPPTVASSSTVASTLAPSPLASDAPGDRALEGAQTPMLTLEKIAPAEVSVGQASPFKIIVRNVGKVVARGVVVTDRVPQGTELVSASPDFSQTADGVIAWELGDLDPGEQAQMSIELIPLVEGEIGSVAQVSFSTQASVRTISTKPGLVVQLSGPEKVLIGEDVIFEIVLSNPGSGATTGIVIEEDVPAGLAHAAGDKLEYEVGTLRPQEEKRLQLVLKADKAGIVTNLLRAKADAGLEASDPLTLEVTSPELQVAIGGPRTRYLERQATYEIGVANPGTSTAYDIELVTFLPKGLKFVSADNKGSYDPQRHAVYWSLAELSAEEQGSVQLTALPIEIGEQKLRVEGRANLNLSAKFEHTTNVQGRTELAFSVKDVHDPIEVGSETMYEIRIANTGNQAATNVQIVAEMPVQLTPISGEGPTKVTVEGQQLFMQPIERIAPRDEVVYRIVAKGIGAGDHVIAVQLVSNESTTPVTKQESTRVYADE
jgi:uncharacterized repeat protein (TIGR01451 family)